MSSYGIVIPSHLSKEERFPSLFQCLQSLLNQTVRIPIALSLSFETVALHTAFKDQWAVFSHEHKQLIQVYERPTKTAQMRHIQQTIQEVSWEYVFFCDDDDTYEQERVAIFIASIQHGLQSQTPSNQFAGSYELMNGQFHTGLFHEYWCYCVKRVIIQQFFQNLERVEPRQLDYVFCDVLFANFLRTLSDTYFFVSIPVKLYNYEKNSYSQLAQIQSYSTAKRSAAEAQEGTSDFSVFIQSIHDALEQDMAIIKDNIFVCVTQFRLSYLEILQQHILRQKYPFKQYINPELLAIFEKECTAIYRLVDALRI